MGDPINDVIASLEKQYTTYNRVEFLYNDANPLAVDIVLSLPGEGIELRFDPASQRLKCINVFDPAKVTLTYSDTPFNSPAVVPTFERVYHKFGPSRGKYDTKSRHYRLEYPGLALFFPVPPEHEAAYAKGVVDLPGKLKHPDGSTPTMTSCCIFSGNDVNAPQVLRTGGVGGTMPAVWPRVGDIVSVRAGGDGIEFFSATAGGPHHAVASAVVRFGDSCQDVIATLGAPERIFYKAEDKMRIHSAPLTKGATARLPPSADYFFNYFHLGIDLLMDAHRHCVKKIVLHTNVPGHFDFARYHKCNFSIRLPLVVVPSADARGVQITRPGAADSTDYDGTMESVDLDFKFEGEATEVTADTKWDAVQDDTGHCYGKPVVFSRAPAANTTNPFPATLFYGLSCLVFEVMHNNHIASVTLFSPLETNGEAPW